LKLGLRRGMISGEKLWIKKFGGRDGGGGGIFIEDDRRKGEFSAAERGKCVGTWESVKVGKEFNRGGGLLGTGGKGGLLGK